MLTPEGRARREALEATIRMRVEAAKIEQREIVNELAEHGFHVETIGDLSPSSSEGYETILPILAKHLRKAYSQDTLYELARAMATKKAWRYWRDLADIYRATAGRGADGKMDSSMGLAAALGDTFRMDNLDELADLLRDKRLANRLLLLYPLRRRRSGSAHIQALLVELQGDAALAKEIGSWKGMKPPR